MNILLACGPTQKETFAKIVNNCTDLGNRGEPFKLQFNIREIGGTNSLKCTNATYQNFRFLYLL